MTLPDHAFALLVERNFGGTYFGIVGHYEGEAYGSINTFATTDHFDGPERDRPPGNLEFFAKHTLLAMRPRPAKIFELGESLFDAVDKEGLRIALFETSPTHCMFMMGWLAKAQGLDKLPWAYEATAMKGDNCVSFACMMAHKFGFEVPEFRMPWHLSRWMDGLPLQPAGRMKPFLVHSPAHPFEGAR